MISYQKKYHSALGAGAAAVSLGLSWTSSTAQERSTDEVSALEEVTVTAQRREENLQNVPMSISAFTSATIQQNMFRDVGDYLVKTPNASFVSTGARSRREISIRGVTNFLVVDGALRTSTFGFYVDGFSISGTSVNPPVMDVERIEVLRGPQATYFGRNAEGGGISITTNKPINGFDALVSADYGRFNTLDLEGMLNFPIIDGKLAARFNAKYTGSDGNIKNINPIGGGNDSTYKYYKGSLRFTPTDRLTIDLTGSSVDEKVGMREGVPSGVFAPFEGDTLYSDFPDRNGDGKADPDPDGVGFYPLNRSRVNFNHPQSIGTNFDYGIANIRYETDSLSFSSVTGYMNSDFFIAGDIDGGSRDFFNEYRHTPRKSFSQEFRLQNTGRQSLLWNFGVMYAKDKGSSDNRTYVGADERFGLPDGFLIDSSDSAGSSRSWAVFGQLDWKIIDALTLSFGGRYSRENIRQTEIGFSGATLTSITADNTFSDFSPRFAVGYLLTDYSRLYGSVSKGFKSGGVQVSPLPGADSYDPETLWNYELGWKADLLDGHVRLNAAAFFMNWRDLQTSYQQSGTDEHGNLILFGGIVNADKAQSKGVELTATMLPIPKLLLNFSAGYLDARYKRFTAYLEGQNRVLDGKTIPNSPKWTLGMDGEHRFDLASNLEGFVRAEWSYRSAIRAGNDALIHYGFPWQVPAYDTTNFRVGVRADHYTVALYSENVFDQVYFLNSYSKAFMGGNFIEPSVQRYGVRVTYDFK